MIERRDPYDAAPLLTRAALGFVGYLILFVSGIIGAQIWMFGEANTESWAALTGIIGWVLGTVGQIYNARYGSSKAGETKDAVIAQQSRTAEAIASGVTSGTAQTPITQAGTVNVEGENVTVTEVKP